MTLRVLVIDDTVVFRKGISEALKRIPEVEIVGTATNGALAIKRIAELSPDLITLDVEMPEMDGLEVLQEIRRRRIDVGVVMLSALTLKGSRLTVRCLELGAFDFIPKPDNGALEDNISALINSFTPIIRVFLRRKEIRTILASHFPRGTSRPAIALDSSSVHPVTGTSQTRSKIDLVVIGVSTGGPAALAQMLPTLPADLGVPVVIVQHMPELFTRTMAESLDAKCALHVKEAQPGEIVSPNNVYVAPGGKQTKIDITSEGSRVLFVTNDPPENNCKPSVDYLFRSVAYKCPGRSCAVIMTGMGSDGTLGLRVLKRVGCHIIAQDAASSVVFGMPRAAIEAGVVDSVLPLDAIGPAIIQSVKCLPI
jgi:two-component system, chemotaxis family, protein-glutamate methylesterase/glutaminase